MGDLFTIQHLLLILLIVVLVFGTKKLRNIGSDLGGAVRGFKEGMAGSAANASDEKKPLEEQPTAAAINESTAREKAHS